MNTAQPPPPMMEPQNPYPQTQTFESDAKPTAPGFPEAPGFGGNPYPAPSFGNVPYPTNANPINPYPVGAPMAPPAAFDNHQNPPPVGAPPGYKKMKSRFE